MLVKPPLVCKCEYVPTISRGTLSFTCNSLMWHVTYINILTSMHYNDVIMSTMTSQITSLTIVYWTVYSGTDQKKHQSTASLAFVRGIHRGPVNSPHKGPVAQKMFPFDDVIMELRHRSKHRAQYTLSTLLGLSNTGVRLVPGPSYNSNKHLTA